MNSFTRSPKPIVFPFTGPKPIIFPFDAKKGPPNDTKHEASFHQTREKHISNKKPDSLNEKFSKLSVSPSDIFCFSERKAAQPVLVNTPHQRPGETNHDSVQVNCAGVHKLKPAVTEQPQPVRFTVGEQQAFRNTMAERQRQKSIRRKRKVGTTISSFRHPESSVDECKQSTNKVFGIDVVTYNSKEHQPLVQPFNTAAPAIESNQANIYASRRKFERHSIFFKCMYLLTRKKERKEVFKKAREEILKPNNDNRWKVIHTENELKSIIMPGEVKNNKPGSKCDMKNSKQDNRISNCQELYYIKPQWLYKSVTFVSEPSDPAPEEIKCMRCHNSRLKKRPNENQTHTGPKKAEKKKLKKNKRGKPTGNVISSEDSSNVVNTTSSVIKENCSDSLLSKTRWQEELTYFKSQAKTIANCRV